MAWLDLAHFINLDKFMMLVSVIIQLCRAFFFFTILNISMFCLVILLSWVYGKCAIKFC